MTCNPVALLLLSTWAVGWWPALRIARWLVDHPESNPFADATERQLESALRGFAFLTAWGGAPVVVPCWLAVRVLLPALAAAGRCLQAGGTDDRR